MGLNILKDGENLRSFKSTYGNSSLLSKSKNFEVIEVCYSKGAEVLILPLKFSDSMDYYYVISGSARLSGNGEDRIVSAGDSFSIQNIEEIISFYAVEDVKAVWFSSEPTFDINYEYHDLRFKYLDKIQQRDHYTAEHCSRVAEYTLHLLKKMNFSIERIVSIMHSATLHDIGKIHIPDFILNKPDKLAYEEFSIMKKHSSYGYDMVKDVVDEIASTAILQHHERLNGSGYPFGLKGGEISLEAKILAVVDSYDAMTTDRPYKKGMTAGEAVLELRRCIGTLYEEEIVSKFEEVLVEGGILPGISET